MNFPSRQRGLSALSILVIILVAVFFATCAVKLIPEYLEYQTIKSAVETVVEDAKNTAMTKNEMKSKFSKIFQVDRIDTLDVKDISITSEDGKVFVDASYEKRIPLMFNIDVVLKFDQLKYEFSAK